MTSFLPVGNLVHGRGRRLFPGHFMPSPLLIRTANICTLPCGVALVTVTARVLLVLTSFLQGPVTRRVAPLPLPLFHHFRGHHSLYSRRDGGEFQVPPRLDVDIPLLACHCVRDTRPPPSQRYLQGRLCRGRILCPRLFALLARARLVRQPLWNLKALIFMCVSRGANVLRPIRRLWSVFQSHHDGPGCRACVLARCCLRTAASPTGGRSALGSASFAFSSLAIPGDVPFRTRTRFFQSSVKPCHPLLLNLPHLCGFPPAHLTIAC